MANAFHTTEDELRLKVRNLLYETHNETAKVCDEWLLCAGISCKQYLSRVVNRGAAIDGLFNWFATCSQNQHLNIVHVAGIWTTRASEMIVMMDAALIFIIRCFLLTRKMSVQLDHDTSSESEFVHPFHHPMEMQDKYIHIPPVLNRPVQDPMERAFEVDVQFQGQELLLHQLIANKLKCEVLDYCHMLVAWMYEHHSDLHMMEKWLAVRDLDLETYAVHLTRGRTSDGLEL